MNSAKEERKRKRGRKRSRQITMPSTCPIIFPQGPQSSAPRVEREKKKKESFGKRNNFLTMYVVRGERGKREGKKKKKGVSFMTFLLALTQFLCSAVETSKGKRKGRGEKASHCS